jgi:hypothetical protein
MLQYSRPGCVEIAGESGVVRRDDREAAVLQVDDHLAAGTVLHVLYMTVYTVRQRTYSTDNFQRCCNKKFNENHRRRGHVVDIH